MVTIAAKMQLRAQTRQFEALSARAWPAQFNHYIGTWAVRVTPDMGSTRLNSITPLDPDDDSDIDARMQQAIDYMAQHNSVPYVRQTPLIPAAMLDWLQNHHWQQTKPSFVMSCPVACFHVNAVPDNVQIDVVSPEHYVEIAANIQPDILQNQVGLSHLLARIKADIHCYSTSFDNQPAASMLTITDGSHSGIFNLETAPDFQRRHLAQSLLNVLYQQHQSKPDHILWLQVEADNHAALALYQKCGFEKIYDYSVWSPS